MLQNYLNVFHILGKILIWRSLFRLFRDLASSHNHNTNLINLNTITLYILDTKAKFCPTKGDLVSRYLFVFNSPHLSRTCLIGIRDMIRGGSPSYHFPIEHCVIILYTNVKICVKAFTTNTITFKFTSQVLLLKKSYFFWAVLLSFFFFEKVLDTLNKTHTVKYIF